MYGELITRRAHTSTAPPQEADGASRKRRRKRRRKTKKLTSPSSSVTAHGKSWERGATKEESSSSMRQTAASDSNPSSQLSVSVGSSVLVSYGESSTSAGESDADEKLGHLEAYAYLPIPSAIQDMYKNNDEQTLAVSGKQKERINETKSHESESDEVETLGFFEPQDSWSDCDSDDDNSGTQEANVPLAVPSEDRVIPDVSKQWSERKAQWLFGPSQLSSYVCWKCSNVGHLAQDCTVRVGQSGAGAGSGEPGATAGGGATRVRIPPSVQNLLATCREIKKKKNQRCADCGIHSNLVSCLDCG